MKVKTALILIGAMVHWLAQCGDETASMGQWLHQYWSQSKENKLEGTDLLTGLFLESQHLQCRLTWCWAVCTHCTEQEHPCYILHADKRFAAVFYKFIYKLMCADLSTGLRSHTGATKYNYELNQQASDSLDVSNFNQVRL